MEFFGSGSFTIIGSLPHTDRFGALSFLVSYLKKIPAWPQLTAFPHERMTEQYKLGLPGLTEREGRFFIDTQQPHFEEEVLQFYEDFLQASNSPETLMKSRFAFNSQTGASFFAFLDLLQKSPVQIQAVKGQITGPFTLSTCLVDENKRYSIYEDRLRDMIIKGLSMNAHWQVSELKSLKAPVLIFIDEPAMAGYGSSAFLGVSEQLVLEMFDEVVREIHSAGALAGVHVCANTDWGLIFKSNIDIISFDAFGFFDRFELFKDDIRKFLLSGKNIAWGVIPTMRPEDIENETPDRLVKFWASHIERLQSKELPIQRILKHSLITPSCGCGTLSQTQAERVVRMGIEVSDKLISTFPDFS